MASTPYAVALSQIVADRIRVEPREAVAVIDLIWGATEAAADAPGAVATMPRLDAYTVTAFGDLEVNPAGGAAADAGAPDRTLATALCKVFWTLMTSGRPDARGLPADLVDVLSSVERQRRDQGDDVYDSSVALLRALSPYRGPDGSVALAQLYARWDVAAHTPGPPMAAAAPPLAPPATIDVFRPVRLGLAEAAPAGEFRAPRASGQTARSGRRSRRSARTAVTVTAATLGLVAVAIVASVTRGQRADPPTPTPGGVVTVAVPSPAPVPVPQAAIVDASRSTAAAATATPAPAAPRRLIRAADVAGATPYSPSFVPSTGALVFHSGTRQTALHEASLHADGSLDEVTTVVRDGASSYHVQISPDGSQMAFDSDRDGTRDGTRAVYVADRDGRHARRISAAGTSLVPSWAPDGSRLAFVRADPHRPRVWQVWTADLRTGTLRQLTTHRLGQPWGASWFPDGHRVAYSLEDHLVVLDTRSGARQTVPSPMRGRLVRTPAVSPDGTRIAFQVHQDGMWMLDLASGRTTRVLSDRSAQEFAWSPDGRLVAYHSTRGGGWEIWALRVGGP